MPPPPPAPGATVEVTVEKLVHGGDGLARLESEGPRRLPVFVPFTVPGEGVRIRLGRSARGRVPGELLEVLAPAPERVEPGCEYFFRCGGCQWQHLAPAAQLEHKRRILLETLERLGGIRWTGDLALHASPPWAYRNRVRLQAAPGDLGYFERETHRVLPVSHCPIASPLLNRALAALAGGDPLPPGLAELELAADNDDERLMVHAMGQHAGAQLDVPAALRAFPLTEVLEYRVGDDRFRVSAGSFFQVNRFLAAELVQAALGDAAGGIAADLFSGVGLFALPLARRFQQVEAVESHPGALADLRANAGPIANLKPVGAGALDYLRRRPRCDLVLADPPRAGLGAPTIAALLAIAPARMHLVSCDPATLARDLAALLAGGYRLDALELFDLFPQTFHIETVARLSR